MIETQNQIPAASINRRLSSLRAFFKWAHESGLIKTNPISEIKNIPGIATGTPITTEAILGEFEMSLREEGAADVTVKNYLTDVSEFISWTTRNQPG